MSACLYCVGGHTFVCDCGHKHEDHNLGGGCKHKHCKCSQYSQMNQRRLEETQKEFDYRVLHPGKI